MLEKVAIRKFLEIVRNDDKIVKIMADKQQWVMHEDVNMKCKGTLEKVTIRQFLDVLTK